MSFLNIKDLRKRDKTIKDYLALKKRLKQRNLDDRQNSFVHQRELEEQYEPVIASNERMADEITEQLVPIKEQLAALTARPRLTAVRAGMKRNVEESEPDIESGPVHPPKREANLNVYAPQVQDFAASYMDENVRKATIDTTFGIRYEDGVWKIGNKRVVINEDGSMLVDGEMYDGTFGFWSLVTEKKPKGYTTDDLSRYKELLHETSPLHQDYDHYVRYPRASGASKWTKILKPIWQEFQRRGIVDDDEKEDDEEEDGDAEREGDEQGDGVKMYLQKHGHCYALHKTADGGIKLRPRPQLTGVPGNGLYLRHGGSVIYDGEGLLLGERSPFRNIPLLGWIL